jgi:OmpA family/PEGA domain
MLLKKGEDEGDATMRAHVLKILVVFLAASASLVNVAYPQGAKPGKLQVLVHPKQAYVFVDGRAIGPAYPLTYGPGSRTVKLSPGTHTVLVASYGYKFLKEDVTVEAGTKSSLKVDLEPSGGEVSGPWGRIQIEVGTLNAGDDAILMNGKTPAYFVAHVDEVNNDIGFKQQLVVPPGTHRLTVTRGGKEVWSGDVNVAPNERVIVNISNGNHRTKSWPEGAHISSLARFKAGVASSTIAVAPVSGTISATPPNINCNGTSQLTWNSAETIDAQISGMSPVPTSGQRTVSPRRTTAYDFTATGPGGTVNQSATVNVNPTVVAQIQASPAEVRYRRIGDKVIQQGNTNVSWSASNADAVTVTPFGSVGTEGSRSVSPTPSRSNEGPVDETISYRLSAGNVCGGSETKTATVHLTGSIEPIPDVPLQSVFYPTDYPDRKDPSQGLLKSERDALSDLARGFTKYLEYDPDAKLSLTAHTDTRGGALYNQSLSVRRVDLAKQFLVSQGLAADKIDTAALGDEHPLDAKAVKELESQNPNPAPVKRSERRTTTRLAYQRRVDIALAPTGAASKRFYPNNASDSEILWQRPKPSRSIVEKNQ